MTHKLVVEVAVTSVLAVVTAAVAVLVGEVHGFAFLVIWFGGSISGGYLARRYR